MPKLNPIRTSLKNFPELFFSRFLFFFLVFPLASSIITLSEFCMLILSVTVHSPCDTSKNGTTARLIFYVSKVVDFEEKILRNTIVSAK